MRFLDSKGLNQLADSKKPSRPRKNAKKSADAVKDEITADVNASNAGVSDKINNTVEVADEFFEDEAAENVVDLNLNETIADGQESNQAEPASDPSEMDQPVEHATAPTPASEKRSGAIAPLLGGVIAAGLGAGAMYFADTQGWLGHVTDPAAIDAKFEAQAAEIEALRTELGAVARTEVALSPLETAIADLQGLDTGTTATLNELTTVLTETRTELTATATRLAELELQPIPKAELPTEVMATIETRFSELLALQNTALADIETRLTTKLAEIEAAQTTAAENEEAAKAAAQRAKAMAALSQIIAALESGEPFQSSLAELSGEIEMDIPAVLSGSADEGVTPLAALQASFPDAARKALADTADAAAEDGSISPFRAFLVSQVGARSLEPREGNSPDAILSRAEAAIGQGDIDAALTQIAALPDAGQTPFASWVAQATQLQDAKTAAANLAAEIEKK